MSKQFPLDQEGFNPFGELIGLQFTKCENGFSQCILEVKASLINPHGVIHGGAIYSMADTGMGAALYPLLEDNELCATVEIKIAYFAPTKAGTITCNTKLIHKTRKIASLESEVLKDNKIIAKATGTFYIYKLQA